jgi:phosphate transport system permease protein
MLNLESMGEDKTVPSDGEEARSSSLSRFPTKNQKPKRHSLWEKAVEASLAASVVIVLGFLFFIIADIVVKGGSALSLDFLTHPEVGIGGGGGYANAIVGSIALVGLAIALAFPLAIGSAIFVNEYAAKNNVVVKVIMFASNTLASTPSIVFGAFGFLFFVLFLGFKFSLLAGALTLTIMILPLLLASSIEALKTVPNEYREASEALGASKWQSIRSVTLRVAFPMISGGVIISIGRAIGETAAVLLTAGYSSLVISSIFMPTASMPNLIYKNYEFSLKYPELGQKVYSAALILMFIVLGLNLLARLAARRSPKR